MTPQSEKRFSSNVSKELGIGDVKVLIAVKSDGTQQVFIPEGARLVDVPGRQPQPRYLPEGTEPNDILKYTYEDGELGWCWPDGAGGVQCHPPR